MLTRLSEALAEESVRKQCAFVFLVVLAIYSFRFEIIDSTDTRPTSIWLFNLLEKGTLSLDEIALATGTVEHGRYFTTVIAETGKPTTYMPIGTAILSAPLYMVAYTWLKVKGVPYLPQDPQFEAYRVYFEQGIASICAAFAAMFFFLLVSNRYSIKTALVATGAFALGTSQWSLNSGNLWQHTAIVLLITISLFASQLMEKKEMLALVLLGIAAGLLPTVRPTSIIFSGAILTFVCCSRPKLIGFFILTAVVAALPGAIYNWCFFRSPLMGGYSHYQSVLLNWDTVWMFNSFVGLLASPYRGLLVYSPFVILSLPAIASVFKSTYPTDKLMRFLIPAALLLFASYLPNKHWHGGFVYGARYLGDLIPIFTFLAAATIHRIYADGGRAQKLILHITVILSILIQGYGVLAPNWPTIDGVNLYQKLIQPL